MESDSRWEGVILCYHWGSVVVRKVLGKVKQYSRLTRAHSCWNAEPCKVKADFFGWRATISYVHHIKSSANAAQSRCAWVTRKSHSILTLHWPCAFSTCSPTPHSNVEWNCTRGWCSFKRRACRWIPIFWWVDTSRRGQYQHVSNMSRLKQRCRTH